MHTFEAHTDQVWGVAYSDDSNRLVSVSDDRSMVCLHLTILGCLSAVEKMKIIRD